jgi:hypothetical protein
MPERITKGAGRGAGATGRTPRASRPASATIKSRSTAKRQTQSTPKAKTGVPITDELADKLAEEAERGYDLSAGRPVGRKSLAGGRGQSPRLNIRTTRELYERALDLAVREGKTLSQLARDALERYVKQPK